MLSILIIWFLVDVALVAAQGYDNHLVKELIHPPHGWTVHSEPPKDHVLNLNVFLTQPRFSTLEEHLLEISDPENSRYGNHLTKEEVDFLVCPHPDSVSSVEAWLKSHGVGAHSLSWSDSNDTVSFQVTVAKVESMLKTKYHTWKHIGTGATLIRATQYGLPADLHSHIDVIQPVTSFSLLQPYRIGHQSITPAARTVRRDESVIMNGQQVDVSCNTTMTIRCLKQLYNAINLTASGRSGSSIGVTGYLEQYPSLSDYNIFLQNQTNSDTQGTANFSIVLVNGGINNQSAPAEESSFDTQYAFGITRPNRGVFWSTGGRPPFIEDDITPTNRNEPYADWLNFVLKQEKLPDVITTSYGDSEQSVPESYARRVCRGFAQLGARGVSVIFGSGDGGVGDRDPDPTTQRCFANDGTNRTRFLPTFPASCPYVTSVGSTFLLPERGVSFSGGGFSNVFDRPYYQDIAIPTFLESLPNGTYAGLFNPNGRGIPDLATQGVNYVYFFNGSSSLFSGTSASAPTFAGLVSLVIIYLIFSPHHH